MNSTARITHHASVLTVDAVMVEERAGVVWANTYNKFDPTSPFGGYKESGFGREGGLQGLAAYCQLV